MKQYWNNTKVVCTIGPACSSRSMLKKMILAGMDVARFNFSHGDAFSHIKQIQTVRSIAENSKTPLAILQDLPGPKIRIGELNQEYILLKEGQSFFLTSRKLVGTNKGVSVNHPVFIRQLKRRNIVYLNDGLVKLVVNSNKADKVFCSVVTGGRIYPRKGVSCPNIMLNLSPVTPYDLKCLSYGLKTGVDFVALSFVQKARDITKVKKFIKKNGKAVSVIAKIERKVAFEDIDNIIKASDGIMVARGDLGIEADLKEVPFLQKQIIKKCNAAGIPVITATQMLESMVNNPQPTRAEVSDVANAIIDGSDALMLSEETAIGKYPLKALKMMVDIAAKTEEHLETLNSRLDIVIPKQEKLACSFTQAAVDIADNISAKAILAPGDSISTISLLSRRRPRSIIIALTSSKNMFRKFILFWGTYPVLVKKFSDLKKKLDSCLALIKKAGIIRKNDRVVVMLIKQEDGLSSHTTQVRVVK